MSGRRSLSNGSARIFMIAAAFAAVTYLIASNIAIFGNIFLVMLGFGAVVLIHEFGHFLAAKLSGVKVEAFSIGFPPILAGILRTEQGYQIRILPELFAGRGEDARGGLLSFTIGKRAAAGETEYRIGLIPLGGFVKMLGQDDTGPAKSSDDPRSYANKSMSVRAIVIAAGVFFNAVSAVIIFMIAFLVGINLPPPIVGDVIAGSPAALAGIKPGDEIIEIGDKTANLDFSNIAMAAALSDINEPVSMKVRRVDGSVKSFSLAARQLPSESLRGFGIVAAQSLTVANVSKDEAENLYRQTGLRPGDHIRSIGGTDVQNYWRLEEIVRNSLASAVTVLAEHPGKSGKSELVESSVKLDMVATGDQAEQETGSICSIVPRLRLTHVSGTDVGGESPLKSGDIILSIGDVNNPTYKQMRQVTARYENKPMPIKLLRVDSDGGEKELMLEVTPHRSKDGREVIVGILLVPAYDAAHPVVARTVPAGNGFEKPDIPGGAVITAVNGIRVSNFYDIIAQVQKSMGHRITIDWRLNEETAGSAVVELSGYKNPVTVGSVFADFVPFKRLERPYKAAGPFEAVVIGCHKTVMLITQTYATIRSLVGGLVSLKNLMGPVGIVTLSYRIVADQPLVYYVYFLGLISACIAVFNFLPLPPLDGGLIVIMLVEKMKGSALSERVQAIVAYSGWILIGVLFIYVTFNDIVRGFFS